MKLVVGLGNPGEKYKNTRHNVGFLVVERLKEELGEDGVIYLKPDTFMNKSGVAVKAVMKKNPKIKNDDVYIIHDDLDIKLGEYKILLGKGPKEHNGLQSIYEQIGTKDFWHVRVGIDNRMKLVFEGSGEDYVLSNWKPEEREVMRTVVEKVVKELKDVFA